ncbi:MAG: preprotein translocase subunit SecG [Gammaproteobacteria bacterium]|nr:preprotein translocase subunit SecG [Gammaproteobacteria bacterium]
MNTTQTVVLVAHTFIAVLIIVLVLLQRGKGAEAGAAFGAGASGTVFGARGSTSFFSRMTAILAAAFFASSLTLAYLSSQSSAVPDSLLESAPAVEETVEDAAVPAEAEDVPALPADAVPGAADSDVPLLAPDATQDDEQPDE